MNLTRITHLPELMQNCPIEWKNFVDFIVQKYVLNVYFKKDAGLEEYELNFIRVVSLELEEYNSEYNLDGTLTFNDTNGLLLFKLRFSK